MSTTMVLSPLIKRAQQGAETRRWDLIMRASAEQDPARAQTIVDAALRAYHFAQALDLVVMACRGHTGPLEDWAAKGDL